MVQTKNIFNDIKLRKTISHGMRLCYKRISIYLSSGLIKKKNYKTIILHFHISTKIPSVFMP